MLKFLVYDDGQPASSCPLRNTYLLGSDGNAMRGSITFDKGTIFCDKRETGVAALAIQQPVGDCGELTVQTCLLPDRDEPYLLSLELARHRLMTIYNKSEDWGMFELRADHPASKRIDKARKLFIEALCAQKDDPGTSDKLARESLVAAIDGSEELAIAHAELLLTRRRATGALPRYIIGGGVALGQEHSHLREGVLAHFDFVNLPVSWKALAPEEGEYRWEGADSWVKWAYDHEVPVVAGPLVSFEPNSLPDWLFIWEHDYDTVRDLTYEHVERIVTRYKERIYTWNVVSGLHINNHFTIAFDQLIDLTRMVTMVVKKVQPAAKVMVELREPFGEYYGSNQRSIPPMMYADLLIQGAIHFDAFSIKLHMGQPVSGQFARDLMQISNLLDHFSPLGKPVHLVIDVPSSMVTEEMVTAPEVGMIDPNCGFWRKPWNQVVQGHWLDAVMRIALSKPFVESVAWGQIMDHPDIEMPLGGLVSEDLQPKQGLRRMASFRKSLATPANGQQASGILAHAGTVPPASKPDEGDDDAA